MELIIIIISVLIACIAGYILRMGIESFNEEQVVILTKSPISSIPNYILTYFSLAAFLLLMSVLILGYTLEMPL